MTLCVAFVSLTEILSTPARTAGLRRSCQTSEKMCQKDNHTTSVLAVFHVHKYSTKFKMYFCRTWTWPRIYNRFSKALWAWAPQCSFAFQVYFCLGVPFTRDSVNSYLFLYHNQHIYSHFSVIFELFQSLSVCKIYFFLFFVFLLSLLFWKHPAVQPALHLNKVTIEMHNCYCALVTKSKTFCLSFTH